MDEVAVTHAGVHLPVHRMDGKRAADAGLIRGFEALRVPAWDEDAFTMALEAGLKLPEDAFQGVERIRLFVDGEPEQAGLAALALDLDAAVTVETSVGGLLAELAGHGDREEVWLAAGADVGGAGVALRVGSGEGAHVVDAARADGSPLSGGTGALRAALDRLDAPEEVPRVVPPGQGSTGGLDPFGLEVGRAGPAAGALEIVHRWAGGGKPTVVGQVSGGQALAVEVDGGPVDVTGLDAGHVELSPEAFRQRERADPPAWSEASQGAYVSREIYDAQPTRRYGARARGPGVVQAATTIEAGPPGEFQRQHEASGAYDVVIVDLDDEEGREIGQAAVPPGRLSIGDRVRPVVRRLFSMEGQVRYALKWWPEDDV